MRNWITRREAATADGLSGALADIIVDLKNFSRLVVPILQERGLFQKEQGRPVRRGRFGVPFANRLLSVMNEVAA
ncbi:hypothetical protein [Micromonospora sp. NBC_01796]|uniref:hypothetical protein n=1 Tax=Micromonospora sp. NBC_01796 TaxID=2975987 RepID=UPI002DDC6D83|nr:hypothetical protein [Micromonospora sp. NBC_01796]WSA86030.1 hypothetical protein OIE47_37785 [Micromonospora sp. NBC_01796]